VQQYLLGYKVNNCFYLRRAHPGNRQLPNDRNMAAHGSTWHGCCAAAPAAKAERGAAAASQLEHDLSGYHLDALPPRPNLIVLIKRYKNSI
jgi:hypothetical protein